MYCSLVKVKHSSEQAHIWTSALSSCVPSAPYYHVYLTTMCALLPCVPYYHVCLTTSTIIEKNRMMCLDQQMSASVSWGNNAVAGLWHVTLWYAVPGALFSRCLLQFHEGTILWLACSWPMTGVVVWCTVHEQLYKIQLCKIQLCKIQLLWQCECSASCSLWMLEDTSPVPALWMNVEPTVGEIWMLFVLTAHGDLSDLVQIWDIWKQEEFIMCGMLEQPPCV